MKILCRGGQSSVSSEVANSVSAECAVGSCFEASGVSRAEAEDVL